MSSIPCINPTCVHQFTAQEVAQANVLKCPRCGQEIQVRSQSTQSAAPPGKKSPPAAKPSSRPNVPTPPSARTPPAPPPGPTPSRAPVAKPIVPAAPVAAAPSPVRPAPVPPPRATSNAASPPPPPAGTSVVKPVRAQRGDDDSEGGVSYSPRRGTRGWGTVLAVCFIILGSILAVILGIRRFRSANDSSGGFSGPTRKAEYDLVNAKGIREPAFEIIVPKVKETENGWTPNGKAIDAVQDIAKKLKARAVWFNTAEDVWLMVSVADYELYQPRKAELIRVGVENLNEVYGEYLEMDQLPKPSQVAGQEAQKLIYKGRPLSLTVIHWGELHFFSHHGIGYWVYAFGPELEKCQKALDSLESVKLGVRLADKREGWKKQDPPTETFASISGAATLTVSQGVYEKAEAPKEKDIDIVADLYLLGRYRKEKDNRKNAHVQVFQLEMKPNLEQAMQRARDHVLSLATAGGATGYTLTVSPDADDDMGETGKTVDIGERKGQLGEFCIRIESKPERFVLLAVVLESDRIFVVSCDVVWDNRQIWYQEFHDLVRTLRLRKG